MWNKGLARHAPKSISKYWHSKYKINTYLLQSREHIIHPELTSYKLCTVMVYIAPYQPYWVQVPCDDSQAAIHWICKCKTDLHISGEANITSLKHIGGSYLCDRGLILIQSTCLLIVSQNTNNYSSLDNNGIDHQMSTVILPNNISQWPLLSLLSVLANYGMNQFYVNGNTSNKNSHCLTMEPETKVCHPHKWEPRVSSTCVTEAGAYRLIQKAALTMEGCSRGQHECQDGSCILQTQLCDGVNDCDDGKDEQQCWCTVNGNMVNDILFCSSQCVPEECTCPPMYYQCKGGGCIQYSFMCDHVVHCRDGSDEICNGTDHTTNKTAGPSNDTYFTCDISGYKILSTLVNDLISDCPGGHGEDEIHYKNVLDRIVKKDVCPIGYLPCVLGHPRCFHPSEVCMYDLDIHNNIKYCRNAAHLENCDNMTCTNTFKCPDSYCIPYRRVCDGVPDCTYGEDENGCETFICPGMLKCRSLERHTLICVHPYEICDGIIHCEDGVDEVICNAGPCPEMCSCLGFAIHCDHANLETIPHSITKDTTYLSLSHNHIYIHLVLHIENLVYLDLSYNNLSDVCGHMVQSESHQTLLNLYHLILSGNLISSLFRNCFSGLKSLQILELQGNKIKYLYSHYGLQNINTLDISSNQLITIDSNIITMGKLDYLNIENNPLHDIDISTVYSLRSIDVVLTDDTRFCCIISYVDICKDIDLSISSCSDMISNTFSRLLIWLFALLCLILNGLSIYVRTHKKTSSGDAQSALVRNLCMSDFLCGVYLITIASADLYYKGIFTLQNSKWRASILCHLAAVMSAVSYLTSAIWLDVITLFRCITIASFSKFTFHDINMKYISITIWPIVFIIATFPLIMQMFTENKHLTSSICLSIAPMGKPSKPILYFAIVSNIFIMLSFILVIICYAVIYKVVQYTRKGVESFGHRQQSNKGIEKIQLFIMLITITNTLCWSPFCVISFVTIAGYQLPPDIMNVIVGIAMPLNSILNPCFYTLSTLKVKHTSRKRN